MVSTIVMDVHMPVQGPVRVMRAKRPLLSVLLHKQTACYPPTRAQQSAEKKQQRTTKTSFVCSCIFFFFFKLDELSFAFQVDDRQQTLFPVKTNLK